MRLISPPWQVSAREFSITIVACAILISSWSVFADSENHESVDHQGIPGILQFAENWQDPQKTPVANGPATKIETHTSTSSTQENLITLNKANAKIILLETQLRDAPQPQQLIVKDQKISELEQQLSQAIFQSQKAESLLAHERQAKASKPRYIERLLNALPKVISLPDPQTALLKQQLASQSLTLKNMTRKLEESTAPVQLNTAEEKQSYAAGISIGRDIIGLQNENKAKGISSDTKLLLAGINDIFNGTSVLDDNAVITALSETEEKIKTTTDTIVNAQEINGQKYIENFIKEKNAIKSDAGFWYHTDYPGDGVISENDTVDLVVTEMLVDGTVIQDMEENGRFISHPLNSYPPLFQEGIKLLKNHGTLTMVVPPDLAYGKKGYLPLIPPGATMIYKIRVSDVHNTP